MWLRAGPSSQPQPTVTTSVGPPSWATCPCGKRSHATHPGLETRTNVYPTFVPVSARERAAIIRLWTTPPQPGSPFRPHEADVEEQEAKKVWREAAQREDRAILGRAVELTPEHRCPGCGARTHGLDTGHAPGCPVPERERLIREGMEREVAKVSAADEEKETCYRCGVMRPRYNASVGLTHFTACAACVQKEIDASRPGTGPAPACPCGRSESTTTVKTWRGGKVVEVRHEHEDGVTCYWILGKSAEPVDEGDMGGSDR